MKIKKVFEISTTAEYAFLKYEISTSYFDDLTQDKAYEILTKFDYSDCGSGQILVIQNDDGVFKGFDSGYFLKNDGSKFQSVPKYDNVKKFKRYKYALCNLSVGLTENEKYEVLKEGHNDKFGTRMYTIVLNDHNGIVAVDSSFFLNEKEFKFKQETTKFGL